MIAEPPPMKVETVQTETRGIRMWWWVGFLPVAVLIGGVGGLLVRTYHVELIQAAAPLGQLGGVASPVAPAEEGWRLLFSKQEWRGPSHGIGRFNDGLLQFRGTIARPQPSADAAIRARVVIHGPLPPPASVFLRSSTVGQYRWVLDVAQRNARLLYEGKGAERELGRYRLAKPLVEGDRVLLELRAAGEEIAGSINGVEVVQVHDAHSAGGERWGIAGDGVWLEAVEVWEPKPDKAVAAAATPATHAEPPTVAIPSAVTEPPVPLPVVPTPVAPAAVASVPTSPATPAPVDTAKWLSTTDAQWRATYEREVAGPLAKGAAELRRQHLVALESPLAAATKAKREDEAAAWRAERDQVAKGNNPPAIDEETAPPALKLLRANFRAQFTRLDKERFEHARALLAKCDDLLAKSQATLVQRQRPDDAASVQKERDQLRQEWLRPAAVITTALPPMTKPAAPLAKITSQQIVEKLVALNASVWVKRGKAETVEVKSESEVSVDEKLTFMRVEFRAQKRDESKIETADYAILDSLSEVPELVLSGAAVKDSVMEKLRPFRTLKNLALNGAKPSPAGYAVLATLPELHDLQLNDTDLKDEAMKTIVQCHKLQRLHLSSQPLTDVAFAEIGKLGALEELGLNGLDKLGSPAFAHFAECRSLKRIYLSGFLVLSGMVENLGKCKDLETLGMPGTGLKDADIAPLGGLAKLKALDLNGSAVTGSAFAAWPQRTQITLLNLSNSAGVDDPICKNIEHTFPKLEELHVKIGPAGLSSEGAGYLARLRTLRNLQIEGVGINDNIVAELAHRDTLTMLTIPEAQLTEAGVASLARLPHLADLTVYVPPITEAALKAFARCKELKTVHIGKDADPETEFKFLKNAAGITALRPEE